MATLNLTKELELLVADIVRVMPEFGHIDPQRVLVCIAPTRSGGIHGTYARIHPLRFEGGSRTVTVRRRGKVLRCEIPPVMSRGVEVLYIICFLVPRFLNLSLREKLVTVFHELFHIAPDFSGDIRRFPGKNYAHGSSRKRFNELMEKLVGTYLERVGSAEGFRFLDGDMETIRARYGTVVGKKMAAPRVRYSVEGG